jgi:cobalt-zinc-cadmium efflux system protein
MHSHDPSHSHSPADFGRAFAVGVALNAGFVAVELYYGISSNSLALVADAGHNLGDTAGLLVAWGAIRLSRWQPTRKHTYGLRKSTILAALFNALFLMIGVGAVSFEAIRRFHAPAAVDTGTMIAVAAVGIAVNAATAVLFAAGRKDDLNIRGAFLHMVADAAVSAGVVAGGVAIAVTGAVFVDPALTLAIAVVIFLGTWSLLRESLHLALDAVPENVDSDAVRTYLAGLPSVTGVHHLHIWGLSTTDVAMTAHLVLSRPDLDNALLSRIRRELHEKFRIEHATVQFEACENDTCLSQSCSWTVPRRHSS